MTLNVSREVRWFILGALAAGIIAVLITVIVVAAGRGGAPASHTPKVDLANSLSSLDVSDFKIPKSYNQVWKQKWYPSRKREKRWTWTEVQRFWIDPRKSLLTSISSENDKTMKALFKGVK